MLDRKRRVPDGQENHAIDLSLDQIAKFWRKVDSSLSGDACWNWRGQPSHFGYGRIAFNGIPYMAHRVSYVLEFGPIPDGLTIDHKCRNKACVRPDHLEAVTRGENTIRRFAPRYCERCGEETAYGRLIAQPNNQLWCATCHWTEKDKKSAIRREREAAKRRLATRIGVTHLRVFDDYPQQLTSNLAPPLAQNPKSDALSVELRAPDRDNPRES